MSSYRIHNFCRKLHDAVRQFVQKWNSALRIL